MTITVSLSSLGLLKAIDVVTDARRDALRQREAEPNVVSVNVGARTEPTSNARPTGQNRVVDVLV
ncbi:MULTISPECIES: hypothetical protein [unclassified Methylobacterium]|uniref:hypothetical protein n=1 Tax=unclassified Methylobacterium TaxID=2615210 RepID=UPI0006F34FD4|nr:MULTISPECIES: hypothetical protein [unclassified Methylobacterium]KQO51888.1 hypothetical protein ASF08_04015 [Methylobacterium sp. Leaf85]KQP09256.1 hypothetical protein ASF26_04265 [Methylobacterium sp. Leaf93]